MSLVLPVHRPTSCPCVDACCFRIESSGTLVVCRIVLVIVMYLAYAHSYLLLYSSSIYLLQDLATQRPALAVVGMGQMPLDTLVEGWVLGHFIGQMPVSIYIHDLILSDFPKNIHHMTHRCYRYTPLAYSHEYRSCCGTYYGNRFGDQAIFLFENYVLCDQSYYQETLDHHEHPTCFPK